VSAPVDRGLNEEAGEPKYARIELERRWRADRERRPALAGCPMTLIEDRYIDGTRLRLRRMTRADLGEVKCKLTKKYECNEARARPIVTSYLTEPEYDRLLALPAHGLIKRRQHVEHQGRWWSLDLFDGALAGLELVECEAEDRRALDALTPPDWALHEVTDLPQWQGGALSWAQAIPED
jgi:CYTH domain-containing protein